MRSLSQIFLVWFLIFHLNLFVCRYEFSHEYDTVDEICKTILNQTKHRPTIGIICGTGLSSLGDIVEDKDAIPYDKIKHFPKSTGMYRHGCKFLNLFSFAVQYIIYTNLCIVYSNIGYGGWHMGSAVA